MGPQERCPICNRWGSSKLEGYCKTCNSNRYKDDDEKNPFEDFVGNHESGTFFPDDFGAVKKKFGYEER